MITQVATDQEVADNLFWDGVDKGDIQLVLRAYVKGANIDAQDGVEQETALMRLLHHVADGNVKEKVATKAMKALLALGADITLEDSGGNTAHDIALVEAMRNHMGVQLELILDDAEHGIRPELEEVLDDLTANMTISQRLNEEVLEAYEARGQQEVRAFADTMPAPPPLVEPQEIVEEPQQLQHGLPQSQASKHPLYSDEMLEKALKGLGGNTGLFPPGGGDKGSRGR